MAHYQGIIAYDGTRYFGWQKTKSGPSIQEEIEKAIFRLTQETISVEGASRTDRGVHAEGQMVSFQIEKFFEPRVLLRALNALIPHDIRVKDLFFGEVQIVGKEYHYKICVGDVQLPMKRLYSWHFHQPLDLDKINQAKDHLIGTHDFSAFANEPEKNPICTIESLVFDRYFKVKGDRFLYKMVRNLVGTLLYIGSGKLQANCLPSILASKDRKQGGMTAPAHGLYLHQVFYKVK